MKRVNRSRLDHKRALQTVIGILIITLAAFPYASPTVEATSTNAIQNPSFEDSSVWEACYNPYMGTYAQVSAPPGFSGSASGLTNTTDPKQDICAASLYQSLDVPVRNLSIFSYRIRKGNSAADGYYSGDVCIYLTGSKKLLYYHGFDGSSPPTDGDDYKYISVGNPRKNFFILVSRNLYNDLISKFGPSIVTYNVTGIELYSYGSKNLETGKKYGQRVNWDCIFMESEPVTMPITLTASSLEGELSGGESIWFDSVYFDPDDLPETIMKYVDTYNVDAEGNHHPQSQTRFVGWKASGAISVSSLCSPETTITVWGPCTLEAVFQPEPFKSLWTFMVYVAAASDDLAPGGMAWLGPFQINQMEKVGSTDLVQIWTLYDWDDDAVPRYENLTWIKQDDNPSKITSPTILQYQEPSMGDPDTLATFATECIIRNESLNYALILMNHGAGFRRICSDIDNGENDYLTMPELQTALEQIEDDNDIDLDLVACEACLMGQLEVAYQVKDCAEVFVASEELMWFNDIEEWGTLPYEWILGNLTANPLMDAQDLGTQFIQSYEDHCQKHQVSGDGKAYRTLSATDTSDIDTVASDISALALWLTANVDTCRDSIDAARDRTIQYALAEVNDPKVDHVDAYNFTQCLAEEIDDSTCDALCQAVMNSIDDAVFAEYHELNATGSHGLSLYFPYDDTDFPYDDTDYWIWGGIYDMLAMSNDDPPGYQWDEFLHAYLGIP